MDYTTFLKREKALNKEVLKYIYKSQNGYSNVTHCIVFPVWYRVQLETANRIFC